MENNFDVILTQLGTGKWNMFYYVMLMYWYGCVCYHTLGGAFFAPEVGHKCLTPEYAINPTVVLPTDFANKNVTSYKSETGKPNDEDFSCSYLVQDNTTDEIKEIECDAWDFDNSTFVSTVTSEFGLVCNYEYLRATYQSIYMFGIFVGAGINGYMADRFGRKRMISIGATFYTLIALTSAWLPSISTILAARFFLGTMHPTSLQTGFILGMEVTEPKYRTAIGIVQFLSWAVATILWGAWAYLIREWRWLQLAVSLPCFVFLPSLLIMDESPRWLIVVGRHEEALRVLEKAARWNKAELPPREKLVTLMAEIHKKLSHGKKEVTDSIGAKLRQILHGLIILFKTPKLRVITLVMYVDFFVVAMVYFGLNLSSGSFKVDPFLYMVIAGIVEVPSNSVTIPVVEKLGRKKPLIFCYILCGISMLLQPLIPTEYNWLLITMAMIGKLCISIAFQIVFLYGSELFPTEVRTRGMGTAMMSSRAGAMISPFLMSYIGSVYPWTTPVVFGLTSIIAGLSSIPLSETLNTALPDTITDLEYDNLQPDGVRNEDL